MLILAEKTCVVAITSIYANGTIFRHHRMFFSSIYCINNKICLSDTVICIISTDVARYSYIFSPWMKLIGEDKQCLFILFYSIRIWNRNVKQYVLCLFYSIRIWNRNVKQYVLCLFYSCYEMRYILLLFYFIMFHSI